MRGAANVPAGSERERTRRVAVRLVETYGDRPWQRHLPAIDELVATILSQNTSDTNTDRAYASLRKQFPTWQAVIEAPTDDIADAIRSGGLANRKAPRIQAVLREIQTRYASLELDHLAELSVHTARQELTSLHGIGPKTASCVLLFSLGMPAMPVDTHVHRVTKRLGLIDANMSADGAHAVLEAQIDGDRDAVYAFHMHLIRHGRTTCTARHPFCDRCSLIGLCDYAKLNSTSA